MVTPLHQLHAKASGSLRGTKRHVPSPAPAGLEDVIDNTATDANLPQVQVEVPSSWPGSLNFPIPTPATVIGVVSAISLCATFGSLTHH